MNAASEGTMVRRTPRRRRDGQSDEAADSARWELIRAAAQVFMDHGYTATSIDSVAEVLGATKGRVYYYYRSKADLFFDLHRLAMEINLNKIRPIATDTTGPADRLRRMLVAHTELIMDELPLQCVSVQGVQMHLAGSTTPEQRKTLDNLIVARDEYERHFLNVLVEGVEAGEFRQCDPRILIKPLLGALNWMTVWYRKRPDETEEMRKHISDEHTEFLLRGVLRY
ncbi:AcrR family transcriptional regulator [Roseovarius sp. MBR-51]